MCDDKMCGTSNQGGCGCGGHGHMGCGWGHRSLLRLGVVLLVLTVAFWAGFRLGMLKAYFGGYYENNVFPYPMMYRTGNWGPGMMGGLQWSAVDSEEKAASSTFNKK